jgi:hypothetical protein
MRPPRVLPALALACLPACFADETAVVSPPTTFDVERYALRGQFDWERQRLVAIVDVDLRITGPKAGRVTLDSAVDVREVRLAGGLAAPFTADADAATLTIDLAALGGGEGDLVTVTIAYEAATGPALLALPVRRGDPIPVRAVYTNSEPVEARQWMPCHDTPVDRAAFSVDLLVPAGERVVANGELVSDTPEGDGHRVKYSTAYAIPTYLMAFAAGDFEVETATHGTLPISVWHRRGLPGDYAGTLAAISKQMDRFEALLGAYPFEKYALVVLPEFPGGMENAGISFQSEDSVQASLFEPMTLGAHELAHQWFGDLVTVATWDDLWIKEGMASVLQFEGVRPDLDASQAGTLNGDLFEPVSGEKIRDAELAPDDKYTSGPYDRAGWLLTQIRAAVGEETFWKTLRGLLDAHRFGAVGTEEFLGAFAPALGVERTARARAAIDADALPELEVSAGASGGATITLHDPEGTLVTPIEARWISASGAVRTQVLTAEKAVDLAPQGEEYLVPDPVDVHPAWSLLADPSTDPAVAAALAALAVPTAAGEVASFLDLGGAAQLASLPAGIAPIAPAELPAFLAGLDDDPARALAVAAACRVAAGDPAVAKAWSEVIASSVLTPSFGWGIDLLDPGGLAACSAVVAPEELFAAELGKLQTDAAVTGAGDARLVYLGRFALPADVALPVWGNVAKTSTSPTARANALTNLRVAVPGLTPEKLAAYRALFVDVTANSEVISVLWPAMDGLVSTAAGTVAENQPALAALLAVLESPVTSDAHVDAVCGAYQLTLGDATAFAAFGAKLAGAPLSDDAQEALADPTTCP